MFYSTTSCSLLATSHPNLFIFLQLTLNNYSIVPYSTVGFRVPPNTLKVISDTIFSANHLNGAKTGLLDQSLGRYK